MKNDLTCAVVRDLLPSYVEGLASEETNGAVEAHLAVCPDCAARKRAMTAPEQAAEQAETAKEVDYLKRVKRRNRKRVLLSILATAAGLLAVLLLKVFVIGTPLQPQILAAVNAEEERGQLRLELSSMASANAYHGWRVEIENGVASVYARNVLVSALYPSGSATVRVPLEGVDEVWLGGRSGKLVWQNGVLISRQTADLYDAKTPYVGDPVALGRIADGLSLRERLCNYTTTLHTSDRPYEWTLDLESTCTEEGAALVREEMSRLAPMMLALVGNLDQVSWTYRNEAGILQKETLTLEDVNGALAEQTASYNAAHGTKWEALPSVRDYAASAAGLQQLSQLMELPPALS